MNLVNGLNSFDCATKHFRFSYSHLGVNILQKFEIYLIHHLTNIRAKVNHECAVIQHDSHLRTLGNYASES